MRKKFLDSMVRPIQSPAWRYCCNPLGERDRAVVA